MPSEVFQPSGVQKEARAKRKIQEKERPAPSSSPTITSRMMMTRMMFIPDYHLSDDDGSDADDEDPLLGGAWAPAPGCSKWERSCRAFVTFLIAPWSLFTSPNRSPALENVKMNHHFTPEERVKMANNRSPALENVKMNHHFTPEERVKMANVESIDYLAPNSAMYRKWLFRQPHRRLWDRWLMMGLIGTTTGLVGQLLYALIGGIAEFKYGSTRWLIANSNMGVAWMFNTIVSTCLVAAASAIAVGWAPSAIGSGIPEVMAYLNGCMLPKFLSCGLAVGSGIPVGPEGPLIHIGAAIGSALSQGHSTTLK
eukprot:gene7251-362_t